MIFSDLSDSFVGLVSSLFSELIMSRKGHGGLYKASVKEERRKRKAKRRERPDEVY